MNKLRTLLTWGLLLAATHAMGYTITVDPIEIKAGQSTDIVINLTNSETDLTAYQMSLVLPTGVTVQKKSNGKYAYTVNADRHDGAFTYSVKDAADGSVLIAVFSADKDVLTGNSGELIRLPIDVASSVSTSLQGSIRNIEFTDVQSQAHSISDVSFTMTMEGGGAPVIVTDDVKVSVPNVALTPGGSSELVVNMETTRTDLTAYQMKLFLPVGVTVQKKSNGKYAFTANPDVHNGNFTISVKDATDGSVLITCFSADKDVITCTNDELIRLPIDVATTLGSETPNLQGSIKAIEFTTTGSEALTMDDVTFNLAVVDLQPCAAPTIVYDRGELVIESATEGAECHVTISMADGSEHRGSRITLTPTYIITAWATAEGYGESEHVTATLTWRDGGLKAEGITIVATKCQVADVNGDSAVDVADIATIISVMAAMARMQEETEE